MFRVVYGVSWREAEDGVMNSVLHNFSLRSDSVGRLAAVMASVYDLSWKMIHIARL